MTDHGLGVVIDLTDSFVIERIEIDDSLDDSTVLHNTRKKTRKSCTLKTRDSKKGVKSGRKKSESSNEVSYGFGECPICWDELGNSPMASTKCGHVYCQRCLEHSLRQEKKCPTCRCVLKGASAYHPLYLSRH